MSCQCVLFAPRVDWIDEHYSDDVCLENPGLGTLSAVLRAQGHAVNVFDGNIDSVTHYDQLYPYLRETTLLGISADSSTLEEVIAWMPHLRRVYPHISVVIGDWAATCAWKDILMRIPEGVGICVGEGEIPLTTWSKADFRPQMLKKIPGFAVRSESVTYFSGLPKVVEHLEDLPWMDRQVFKRHQSSQYDTLVLMGSRGCPGNCLFCSRPAFSKASGAPAWRPRSLTDLFAEARHLKESHGIHNFFCFDDNFLGPNMFAGERASAMARLSELHGRPYRFRIALCADTVVTLGEEGIANLRRAGVERVFIGMESFSETQLYELGKAGVTPNINLRAVALLEDQAISVHCGFINFTPEVTITQLQQNAIGLRMTRQGAYFRHFRSILYYGPGSRVRPSISGTESVGDYRDCMNNLAPDIANIRMRLENLYKEIRPIDYELERLDFSVIRALDIVPSDGIPYHPLYVLWQSVRANMAKCNQAVYEQILRDVCTVPAHDLKHAHLTELQRLRAAISSAVAHE